MSSPTIRVTLPGYRADTETNPDHYALYGDSDWVLIKEKERGTITVPSGSWYEVTHGLGYIPMVFVFGQQPNDQWALLQGDSGSLDGSIEINTQKLRIWNGASASRIFKYYIFHDHLIAPGLITKSLRYKVSGEVENRHPVLAVAKSGIPADETTDPNDFIYHSDYNTFKIIASGLYEPTVPHGTTTVFTVAHNLEYRPFVMAFMREGSVAAVSLASNLSSDISSYLNFDSVKSDYTNIIFTIGNTHSTDDIVAHIRYFIFEAPLTA